LAIKDIDIDSVLHLTAMTLPVLSGHLRPCLHSLSPLIKIIQAICAKPVYVAVYFCKKNIIYEEGYCSRRIHVFKALPFLKSNNLDYFPSKFFFLPSFMCYKPATNLI
jgi:hypothetical protein